MERAAEMLGHARPDRARGRPPRRLPPARAVRQGLPPPPRPVALGLPDAPRGARPGVAERPRGDRRPSPAGARRPARRRSRRPYRVALRPDGSHRMPRDAARSIAAARAPHRAQMVVVGVIASAMGIALGADHRLVPAGRLHPGRQDRHALGRPDHRLGAGVRARDGGRRLLGHRVPDAARARRTSTGRRSTATRGWRSSGPRSRRSSIVGLVRLRLHGPARHREGAGQAATSASSTSPASSSPGRFDYNERRQEVHDRPALPARRQSVKFDVDVQGRHPRLLGPGLPHEDRRRARHHDALPGDAASPAALGDHAIVCAELCGLGPRLHAPDRARRRRRPLRQPGCQKMTAAPARAAGGQQAAAPEPAADAKQLFTDRRRRDRRHGLRRLPHARRRGHQRPGRPGPRQGPQGQGRGLHQAEDRQPRQGDREGLRQGDHALELRADAVGRAGRRPRAVPLAGDQQVTSRCASRMARGRPCGSPSASRSPTR